jgi:hypothetical protein
MVIIVIRRYVISQNTQQINTDGTVHSYNSQSPEDMFYDRTHNNFILNLCINLYIGLNV